MNVPLLEINRLTIETRNHVEIVRSIDFKVFPKEIVGIVGESGAGKSLFAHAIMNLLPANLKIKDGSILFEGKNLLKMDKKGWQGIRGNRMGMVFQDPVTCLNPTMKVGKQVIEALLHHSRVGKKEAIEEGIRLLGELGIHQPEMRFQQYPYEMSGGMRQRVLLAIALIAKPSLLIADEPTSALDMTIQAQLIELLEEIRARKGTSILFITHDLGLVARFCDRVAVMHQGQIVEVGPTKALFTQPQHSYTQSLLLAKKNRYHDY